MNKKLTAPPPDDNSTLPVPEKKKAGTADGKKAVKRRVKPKDEMNDSALNKGGKKAGEIIVSEAEKSLLRSIRKGNVTSIIFALKTLGRSKGYTLNGYKPNELAARITAEVLRKLTDKQLAELEKYLKTKKDITAFLEEIGINDASD